MAIVKCVTSGSPLSKIFDYITRDEATTAKLIDGIACMSESALEEFREVKARYHKEGGRQYYHFIQSFAPHDHITPEEAHSIGHEFCGMFPGFLWENTGVKRVLQNKFYAGTLVCHKSYTSKINHIRKEVPEQERFRHENFVPAIVSKEVWQRAQVLLADKVKRCVRAGSGKPYHRYTGLIRCGECGSSFVCKVRHWRDKPDRIEYVCNGNHRYGSENCTPHRIGEAELDRLIYEELMRLKDEAGRNYRTIEADVKKWLAKKSAAEKKIRGLNELLEQRKCDQQEILLERIRDREHADVYTEMLAKCEADIGALTERIAAIRDYDATIKKRKAELRASADLIDKIIADGAISDEHLRMLIDRIVVHETDGRLNVAIFLNAPFRRHMDFYDNHGAITDKAFEL